MKMRQASTARSGKRSSRLWHRGHRACVDDQAASCRRSVRPEPGLKRPGAVAV